MMRKIRAQLRDLTLDLIGHFSTFGKGIYILNGHSSCWADNTNMDCARDRFRQFLSFLEEDCLLRDFREVVNCLGNEESLKGEHSLGNYNRPIICFTFDDAFLDCADVIAPVLEEFDIRGGFFVNYNYVWGSPGQREIVAANMGTNRHPMTPEQVLQLSRNGHCIGSHTLDHENLGAVSPQEAIRQIRLNKKQLQAALSQEIDCFAWPYGGRADISEAALEIAALEHRYIFSSFRSKTTREFEGRVLNRQHVESYWPRKHIRYFISHDRI